MENDTSHSGSYTAPGSTPGTGPSSIGWYENTRSLERPIEDRMVAGVAAGLANYLDVDVTIVRIVMAVLAICGGLGVPLYLVGWLLMPSANTGSSIAEEVFHHAAQC